MKGKPGPGEGEMLWTVDDVAAFLRLRARGRESKAAAILRLGVPRRMIGGQFRYIPDEVRAWVRDQGSE